MKTFKEFHEMKMSRTADYRTDRPSLPDDPMEKELALRSGILSVLRDPAKIERLKELLAKHPELARKVDRLIGQALYSHTHTPGEDIGKIAGSITGIEPEPFDPRTGRYRDVRPL